MYLARWSKEANLPDILKRDQSSRCMRGLDLSRYTYVALDCEQLLSLCKALNIVMLMDLMLDHSITIVLSQYPLESFKFCFFAPYKIYLNF